VYEVGVTYNGRTYDEGKKIGWRDGVRAIWCIGRYSKPGERIAQRLVPEPHPAPFHEADHQLATTLDALEGAEVYADWVLSQFADHLGGRILEVGAGAGTMTRQLAAHGEVVAVEPSARAAELLASSFAGDPRVEVVTGTLADVAPEPVFDNAVLINVLEHIPDDIDFLAELRARLAPGGTVLCFVPAHGWLHSRFDDRVGHCRRYRRSTLAEAFGAAGFEIDELRHVNAPGAVAWFAGARVLGMSPSARLAGLYQRTVLPLAQKVEAGRELPFGQSLVAVARAAR
jgi:SAM-dependent methyltransferase